MNKDRNNSVKEYMSRKEPFYNWIIRAVIAIALVAVIIAGSVTVMGKINADRRLYDELVGANKDRIFEQNGGEGVKDNFFEAESALFEGTVSDGENDYGTSAAYSCVVDAGFGGGVALRGIGTSETADKPNTLTFGFVSDKKVRITMTARVNAADVETPFSEIYTVTVNGKSPRNIDDAVLPARSDASVTAVYGYAMADVDLVVDLSPGENTVVVRTAKNADCVIDYLNLKTSAALTGYVSRYRLDEVATIVSAPTDSGAGEITLTDEHYSATYVLPSVMDGLRKGVYTSATGSETVDVMLGASGFVLARSSAQPHTLTVESEYVTFGDSDSATVTVYGKMPQPDFSAPEGYEFYGWYEKDAAENLYGKDDFIMPGRDITLVPIFEDYDYAEIVSDELGKVRLLPESMSGISPIREDMGNGFVQRTLRDGISKDIMTTDGKGEVATVFNYGRVEKGWSFMTMNACDHMVSGTKSLVSYMQNKGNSPISFTVYQTSSSSAPTAGGNPCKTVELAPGESERFIFTFTFRNNNLLSYFEFNAAADELKLACVQYIVTGTYRFPGESAETYTATLKGDALFAESGLASAQVPAGEQLPEVALTGASAGGDRRIVGYIADDGDTETFVFAESFVMPSYDVTLTPYVVLDWDYYTSGGDGVLDFSEEGSETVNVNGNVQEFGMAMISPYNVDSVSRTGRYVLDKGEVGTEYTFTGDAGEYFRLMRAYVVGGTPRTVTYKFRNTGTSDISFTAYQVNSGTDTNGAPSDKVTIAPGEETTISLEFAYTNKNIMCLIVLDEAATNAKLWMSAEISATE